MLCVKLFSGPSLAGDSNHNGSIYGQFDNIVSWVQNFYSDTLLAFCSNHKGSIYGQFDNFLSWT